MERRSSFVDYQDSIRSCRVESIPVHLDGCVLGWRLSHPLQRPPRGVGQVQIEGTQKLPPDIEQRRPISVKPTSNVPAMIDLVLFWIRMGFDSVNVSIYVRFTTNGTYNGNFFSTLPTFRESTRRNPCAEFRHPRPWQKNKAPDIGGAL